MTSRPPLAVSQRQPQRTLSSSGLSQRPAPQRSLSQQYLPPSPIRRSESYNDQGPDAGDVAQNRYGTIPRRGGSRLKLELVNDGIVHAGFSESPQNLDPMSANMVFTPSRVMSSMNEASELGDMSPHTSRCQTVDGDSAPLPMPPRRAQFVVPAKRPPTSTMSAPAKKDFRPKPFVLEPPADAPRYSNMGKQEPSGYADFYPWRGGHAEDQFSDSVIRNGFFNKAPAQSSQETTTARGPLLPALKHKSGLHTLSTIFTGILNQRRHSGQITSASTFKPPPRVTLTDTKREVWLKDLANPAISLRRLSRTIPHGIRGRVLLDQCLNKNVPTDRAVWLAKCVGANEIRAFKRKGVNNTFVIGGEVKWIRDWTLCVEQFLETIVSAFSEDDWKAKVTYAIRLATHLYAEHLLDRDHYMEWLVSGLENSNQAKLPMWLLIIQIYWKDILKLRRYGRRLATAIVNHHCSIYHHPDRDILLPLSTQLCSLVDSLISAYPESFVHPLSWTRFRDSLQSSLSASQRAAFGIIDARNDHLTSSSIKSQPAVRSTLVELLDNMLRMPFKDDIPTKLRKTSDNNVVLIRTVLEWCTSLYRFGAAKVYVAATILRSISTFDVDITRSILDFLDAVPLQENARKHIIYHLVSELVRSAHFSVPQYVQWLIARGGLVDPIEAQPDGPCATRLLVEVPIQSLNESMRSLRASLLRRAGFSVDDEGNDIGTAIKCVKHALSVPLEPGDPLLQKAPMSVKKLAKRIGISSRALKAEVSSWLSNDFIGSVAHNLRSGKGGVELSSRTFETVRALLEAAQDFTMLETTMKLMMQSSNTEILAYCADTINLHLPVFAAMGSAKTLFQALYTRLRALSEEQGIGARPLLASLASLAPRLPGLEQMACQLHNDLIRADRSSAVDVSSPLSDNMATQLQDAETELSEQIEKLASYTSADRPTMERLFQAIVSKLGSCWSKADERQRPYCILLSRLRVFDTQHFDVLMRGWVQHIRKLTRRPPIAQLFPLLVSSGCLSLAMLFATAYRSQPQASQSQPNAVGSASTYMQEILQMLMIPLVPNQVTTSEDCYRFRITQEQARLEHAKEVMPLIRGALGEYAASRSQQPPRPQPLDEEKVKSQLLELLRDLVLVDPNAACQTLSLKSPDAKLAALIEALTTKLLVPHGGGVQKSFEQVLELANEFTLPFCQVKLSLILAIHDSGSPEGAERLHLQFEQLSKAMDNAIEANNIMWTGMLSCVSPDITQHLKNRAESRFFDLLPSLKSVPAPGTDPNNDIHMAENLLTVIDAVLRGGATSRASPLSNAMVDKLADLWEILGTTGDEHAVLRSTVLSHWLPLLLAYLALQASQAASPADTSRLPGSEIRARALIVLAGLVQELDRYPSLKLGERIYDIALVLTDQMPEDARLQCVRAVKDHTSDPRLKYLFSFTSNPTENFMLAHRDKPPPGIQERRALAAMNMGMSMLPEKLTPFLFRRWEILNEPTPNVGENDTSLSLTLFDARKI
ncbi:Uu.00g117500.m01.CDS01 [Anthostomella pinea]|uniref:Mediator of RNA polymerase II transcription subunit 12 n=1 Tax=Anthostomella pinea TaxID=933095 RepID=A0AAI8VGR7_9PEZI|nr:Uu.00g117500.m01.CDS01 [Anthostomella pinea]